MAQIKPGQGMKEYRIGHEKKRNQARGKLQRIVRNSRKKNLYRAGGGAESEKECDSEID
jgi:hypothetical protein